MAERDAVGARVEVLDRRMEGTSLADAFSREYPQLVVAHQIPDRLFGYSHVHKVVVGPDGSHIVKSVATAEDDNTEVLFINGEEVWATKNGLGAVFVDKDCDRVVFSDGGGNYGSQVFVYEGKDKTRKVSEGEEPRVFESGGTIILSKIIGGSTQIEDITHPEKKILARANGTYIVNSLDLINGDCPVWVGLQRGNAWKAYLFKGDQRIAKGDYIRLFTDREKNNFLARVQRGRKKFLSERGLEPEFVFIYNGEGLVSFKDRIREEIVDKDLRFVAIVTQDEKAKNSMLHVIQPPGGFTVLGPYSNIGQKRVIDDCVNFEVKQNGVVRQVTIRVNNDNLNEPVSIAS